MNEREHAPRGVVELRVFFNAKTAELDRLNIALQQAHEKAEQTEEAWTSHLDLIVEELDEEVSEGRRSRLPGEDKVQSIARRRGGAEAWTEHRKAERRVKKLETIGRNIDRQIGACQSESKLLRETT